MTQDKMMDKQVKKVQNKFDPLGSVAREEIKAMHKQ